jgi:hypothetical protein
MNMKRAVTQKTLRVATSPPSPKRNKANPKELNPPKYPNAQPYALTLPLFPGSANSGRNEATKFSPNKKDPFANTKTPIAPTTPHRISPKSIVPTTQAIVATTKAIFFEALRSAQRPKKGPTPIAKTAESDSVVPHAISAQLAPPQIVWVKKTPPTTVTTTVTNALFAKSYQHHAKISPLPAYPTRPPTFIKRAVQFFASNPTNKFLSHAHLPTLVESHIPPLSAFPSNKNSPPSIFDPTLEPIASTQVPLHKLRMGNSFSTPPAPDNFPFHPATEWPTPPR